MTTDTNPCRSWQYNTDKPLHVPSARLSAMRWANRRKFGIVVEEVTPHKVRITTYAPDTRTHNRAVNALARILDAQLDRILYHESCGMIRATIQWHDGGILEDVLIKQTHDVGDDDEDIFFYGLTWDEVKRHLRDGTPVDNEFSIVSACLEC